jgi:hypothetical protein
MREAMSKATGRGLVEAADGLDRVPDGPFIGAWKTENESGKWLLAHIEPETGYSLAVAVLGAEPHSAVEWNADSISRCRISGV